MFINKTPPTVPILLNTINSDDDLPNIQRSTLQNLLKDMGFRYEKVGRNNMLIEKNEIITWRHNYLRQIKKLRNENKTIIYTGLFNVLLRYCFYFYNIFR